MDLKEKLDETVELMKRIKTDWVASKPENTDLAIYLHFWRGDTIVVGLQTVLERDVGLQAGALGAMGFGADTMSIAFESFHSTLVNSPITGKPWIHRELQFVQETHPEAHDKGWVDSCISVAIHERGGEYGFVVQPYLIKGDEVLWLDNIQKASSGEEDTADGGGRMFDYLQQSMSTQTLAEKMASAAPADDPVTAVIASLVDDEEARVFHTDMATYRALEERGLITGIMLGAEPGSKRAEWLEERLGPGKTNPLWTEVGDADVADTPGPG